MLHGAQRLPSTIAPASAGNAEADPLSCLGPRSRLTFENLTSALHLHTTYQYSSPVSLRASCSILFVRKSCTEHGLRRRRRNGEADSLFQPRRSRLTFRDSTSSPNKLAIPRASVCIFFAGFTRAFLAICACGKCIALHRHRRNWRSRLAFLLKRTHIFGVDIWAGRTEEVSRSEMTFHTIYVCQNKCVGSQPMQPTEADSLSKQPKPDLSFRIRKLRLTHTHSNSPLTGSRQAGSMRSRCGRVRALLTDIAKSPEPDSRFAFPAMSQSDHCLKVGLRSNSSGHLSDCSPGIAAD